MYCGSCNQPEKMTQQEGEKSYNGVLRIGVTIDVMGEAQYVVRRIVHKRRHVFAAVLIDQGC
jgi:hypothetical protein